MSLALFFFGRDRHHSTVLAPVCTTSPLHPVSTEGLGGSRELPGPSHLQIFDTCRPNGRLASLNCTLLIKTNEAYQAHADPRAL